MCLDWRCAGSSNHVTSILPLHSNNHNTGDEEHAGKQAALTIQGHMCDEVVTQVTVGQKLVTNGYSIYIDYMLGGLITWSSGYTLTYYYPNNTNLLFAIIQYIPNPRLTFYITPLNKHNNNCYFGFVMSEGDQNLVNLNFLNDGNKYCANTSCTYNNSNM